MVGLKVLVFGAICPSAVSLLQLRSEQTALWPHWFAKSDASASGDDPRVRTESFAERQRPRAPTAAPATKMPTPYPTSPPTVPPVCTTDPVPSNPCDAIPVTRDGEEHCYTLWPEDRGSKPNWGIPSHDVSAYSQYSTCTVAAKTKYMTCQQWCASFSMVCIQGSDNDHHDEQGMGTSCVLTPPESQITVHNQTELQNGCQQAWKSQLCECGFPPPCPTLSPTASPTASPTISPTISPTFSPTVSPTASPTVSPTISPTVSPTSSPTPSPTVSPTVSPTFSPTFSPTSSPTVSPTPAPTPEPTPEPTPSSFDFPTAAPTCDDISTCTIIDDPHIMVFDKAQVSLLSMDRTRGARSLKEDYGSGDMWLVKSRLVSIQAQYMPDEALAQKNLYVKAVAVGGPFLGNSTLVIGPMNDVVTWDGRAVLDPPSSRGTPMGISRFEVAGLLRASQSSDGQVVAELPLNVVLTVKRKRQHVNIFIKMPSVDGGQEGLCGNFNGLAGDDSLDLVESRSDPRVEPGASLFTA